MEALERELLGPTMQAWSRVCVPAVPVIISMSIMHRKGPCPHLWTFQAAPSSSVYTHSKSYSFTSIQAQGCSVQSTVFLVGGGRRRGWTGPRNKLKAVWAGKAGLPITGASLGGMWVPLGLGTLAPQAFPPVELSHGMGFQKRPPTTWSKGYKGYVSQGTAHGSSKTS